MPLNPNDNLLNGHYRILRLLGCGGFGFVYQTQDTLLGDEVAIKELVSALVAWYYHPLPLQSTRALESAELSNSVS